MPWRSVPMKGVGRRRTSWGPASKRSTQDYPNGGTRPRSYAGTRLVREGTGGTETSQYPRKRNHDSVSSGERTRKSPNLTHFVAAPMVDGGCRAVDGGLVGTSGSRACSVERRKLWKGAP